MHFCLQLTIKYSSYASYISDSSEFPSFFSKRPYQGIPTKTRASQVEDARVPSVCNYQGIDRQTTEFNVEHTAPDTMRLGPPRSITNAGLVNKICQALLIRIKSCICGQADTTLVVGKKPSKTHASNYLARDR